MMVTARRARLTGMIMLALAFMVGSLSGAAVMRVAEADGAPKLMRTKTKQPPAGLLERLDLAADQRAQVDAILERRRQEMEAFWNVHRPALQAIADSARTELRAVLTPEQRQLEEQYMEERRAHHQRRERPQSDRW
jgi:Spy/CpxP family protein refolding chaperone